MCYAYWENGRHKDPAVFDLYFRKTPFGGEFAVFAGLEEALRLVSTFHFTPEEIAYLRTLPALKGVKPAFFDWLAAVNCNEITIQAIPEGSIVFPVVPLVSVRGPIAIAQLLETPLLTLVNYATLMATNAARMRLAAGPKRTMLEFGLRRAQGPDGGLSASRYAFLGGFDASSNVAAGRIFGIPISGTHAHSYVTSFSNLDELQRPFIQTRRPGAAPNETVDLRKEVLSLISSTPAALALNTNKGELAAFISYACAFPEGFLALVDTYDTLASGVPNFLFVAAALHKHGYQSRGIRLDSGDLAYLSKQARKMFRDLGGALQMADSAIKSLQIAASNDLNEETILSLNQQGHEIDIFGVGTHLVTCQAQPALGGVFKLVEVNGNPRIKLSDSPSKITLPGRKLAYRLLNAAGTPLVDLLLLEGSPVPRPGERVLCRHPFEETKRAYVTPSSVEPLHVCFWKDGKLLIPYPDPQKVKDRVSAGLKSLREDHVRALNPTPYKVSVTQELFDTTHKLWLAEAPIAELS